MKYMLVKMPSINIKILKNHYLYYRDFPWRHTEDPYKIMIAEFMLVRTKAEQIVPVYINFLNKYPDIKSLSNAKIIDVSKVTNNLGLHKRAGRFIESCKFIENEFDGYFPESRENLLAIPGVGDYTAGVIQAVCYKKTEYIIDSNIARFIDRYYGLKLKGEIRRKKIVVEKSKQLFDIQYPDKFLFSILDFTALICKPRNPDCLKCIFSRTCGYDFKVD